jgi:hypothetical protein
MMRRNVYTTACTLLALLAAGSLQAADPPPLRHDPFVRPLSLLATSRSSLVPGSSGLSSDIELRGTMVGAQGSLADVAGRIMRPGESVDGLRLVRVFDDRAEFEFNGKRLTVYVRPRTESNDE